MSVALITGSAGLVGSEAVKFFCNKGFDVVGWAKNLTDGTVEVHINGEREEVEEFLKEIAEESAMAHNIKNMYDSETELLQNVNGFVILG